MPKLLHELFEETVVRCPSLTAVQWKDESLTYVELECCAASLAGFLSRRGACRGSIVGLMLDRSLEMVVAIIGSLKTGAAYVTLLPTWPIQQRLEILEEAESHYLVLQGSFEAEFESFQYTKLVFDDCRALARTEAPVDKNRNIEATDTAYIIFTSGSTGKPKGVMMHHGGTAHNISCNAHLSCKEGTRCCFSNKYTFDVHVADIFKPLYMGATLVVTRDIFRIPPVDVVSTLPNKIAQAKVPRSLQKIIFTGEGITEACIRPVPVTTQVLNIFGATEFFDATLKLIDRSTFPERVHSIGRPLGDYVRLWVIDAETMEPKSTGEPGELVVGGFQVAKGYIKRPELTATKFVEAPSSLPGATGRVYRTGDLVRCCQDGEYDYLGRVVHRVEVRGQRIDLSSVEAALVKVGGVTAAAAVVVGEPVPRLQGYVSPLESKPQVEAALAQLPEALRPDVIIGVVEWPYTSNGKIDKNRLHELNPDGTLPNSNDTKTKSKRAQRMFRDPEDGLPLGSTSHVQADASDEESEADDDDPKSDLTECQHLASTATKVCVSGQDNLCRQAQMQAYQKGFLMLNKPLPYPPEIPAMTLVPSPLPQAQLDKVKEQANIFNRLVDSVSCDLPWLKAQCANDSDPSTARVLSLADEVYGCGPGAKHPEAEIRLLLSRQDFQLSDSGLCLPVAINASVQLAGLTEQLVKIHSVMSTYCPEVQACQLEENRPSTAVASALAEVHRKYVESAKTCPGTTNTDGSRICFFCAKDDPFEMDQCHIETALQGCGVASFRAALDARVELKENSLFIDGIETSVVHLGRECSPDRFAAEGCWESRRLIELSSAVKVPSILAELALTRSALLALQKKHEELWRFLQPGRTPEVPLARMPTMIMSPGGKAKEAASEVHLAAFSCHLASGKDVLESSVGGMAVLHTVGDHGQQGCTGAFNLALSTPWAIERCRTAGPEPALPAMEPHPVAMVETCILLVCGLPGCGKSSFCRRLLQKSSTEALMGAAAWHHLCYDDVEAEVRVAAGNGSGFDPGTWQAARRQVAQRAQALIAQGDGRKQVLVLDDNMYYRSMRKHWYHFATEQGCSFHQVFLQASPEICLERNRARPPSGQVPDFSIRHMADVFEWPRLEGKSWEAHQQVSIVLDCGNVSTDEQVDRFVRTAEAGFWRPPPHGEDDQPAGHNHSTAHYMDLALRKVVSRALAEAPSSLAKQAKSSLAKRWGSRKAAMVAEFGALTAEALEDGTAFNEMEESFLRSCVADIRQSSKE